MADDTCSVDSCSKPLKHKTKRLCAMHYQRLRVHGSVDAGRKPAKRNCSVPDCTRTGKIMRGWCAAHYFRWKRCGDVRADEPIMDGSATCRLDGCERRAKSRGLCDTHVYRERKYGDPGTAHIRVKSYAGVNCAVSECERRAHARGLCHEHYGRKRTMGDVFAHVPLTRKSLAGECIEPACPRPRFSRGMCQAHYNQWWRSGTGARRLRPEPTPEEVAEWLAKQRASELVRLRMAAAVRRSRKSNAPSIPFTSAQLSERMRYWGDRCWMCTGPFETIDHVKPISKGGAHALMNLRPACKSCNSRKHARWPFPASTR